VDCERPEGVAEALHETMDAVDSLSDEELDMVDPEGKNHEVETRRRETVNVKAAKALTS